MWVLIRRIVAIALGIPLLLAAYDLGKSANGFAGVGMSLVIGALGFFMFYFALVGAGPKQFEWRDDVELHRDNKNRYKWWL